jgi:hypothetical protein
MRSLLRARLWLGVALALTLVVVVMTAVPDLASHAAQVASGPTDTWPPTNPLR